MEKNDNINLNKLIEILNKIEIRLENIEDEIKLFKQESANVKTSCNKMDQHIDFIEGTYNVLRTPLNYITNKVNYLIGSSTSKELPQIENKIEQIGTNWNKLEQIDNIDNILYN